MILRTQTAMKYISIFLSIVVACLVAFECAQAGENLPFVRPYQWSEFTEREREIYVKAVLETWSFSLYRMPDQQQSAADFSAFTACAETEKASRFIFLLYLSGEVDKPVVSHIFDKTPLICKEYTNKGDGSWRPVRLIQQGDWRKYNDKEKKSYVKGYVDFSHFLWNRMATHLESKDKSTLDQAALRSLNKLKKDQEGLGKCMDEIGIEGLLRTISSQKIEWQYPLPWSVATALGNTCKPFREGRVISEDERLIESSVREIEILENSGSMIKHTDYWVTCASGPVEDHKKLPTRIKIGDVITIGKNRVKANLIYATYAKKTIKYGREILQEGGTTTCVIAERKDLLPYDEDEDCRALWIVVKKCRVVTR